MRITRFLFFVGLLAIVGCSAAKSATESVRRVVKPTDAEKKASIEKKARAATTTEYDKFENRTILRMEPFEVFDDSYVTDKGFNRLQVSLRASYGVDGTENRRPASVWLSLSSHSTTWHFLDHDRRLIFLAGSVDRRFDLGELDYDGDIKSNGSVIEDLSVAVPTETFQALALSSNLEASIGGVEFVLPPQGRADLRYFAEQIPAK